MASREQLSKAACRQWCPAVVSPVVHISYSCLCARAYSCVFSCLCACAYSCVFLCLCARAYSCVFSCLCARAYLCLCAHLLFVFVCSCLFVRVLLWIACSVLVGWIS